MGLVAMRTVSLFALRNSHISECDKDSPLVSALRTKSHRRVGILLLLWIAFIFGTSCTVIRPEEFIRLVASLTGAGRDTMERFAVFWGIAWFSVVKGWHFSEFVILTLLTASAVKWWRHELTVWTIIASMLFCIAFAASDEWHQSFVPDRFGTIQDVLIDSLGVFTAGAILLLRLNRHKAINKNIHQRYRSGAS